MLAYDIRGRGPGLVLLHGMGSTAAGTWGTLADALAAEHTVVLPDLPGSGRSPLPDNPVALNDVAGQVVAADAAGLDDFVIAGASLGAAVAIRIAALRPDRVRGLFTLSGFARPRTTLWLQLEKWSSSLVGRDAALDAFLTSLTFPGAARREASAPGTAEQIALALGLDVRGDLPAITSPALVVAAMRDRLVDPEHSVELAEGIPDARLAAIGAGHTATVEEPDLIVELLTGFLRRIGRHTPRTARAAPAPALKRRLLTAVPGPHRPR
ncbi:alpha/beta fold hydrolase [Streptomyces vietnamensis]|uniref:alpha/beta fold hydrolase n=1 Tax=Streptomyces vietnamensis TaxID=362257 RepID=UPI0037891FE4